MEGILLNKWDLRAWLNTKKNLIKLINHFHMDKLLFLVDDSATHEVGQYKWMKCDHILVNLIFF